MAGILRSIMCFFVGLISVACYAQAPNISYATPKVFTVEIPISAISPTNTGGAVDSLGYSVTPALPVGLALDANTGAISGTPVLKYAAINYTVTAKNAGGSANAVVNITVNAAQKPVITYGTPVVYTTAVPITPLAPVNTGGAVPLQKASVFSTSLLGSIKAVTIDRLGNLYFIDAASKTVQKIPVGSVTPVVVASGFSDPVSVAVDSSANIYVVNAHENAVTRIPAGGGAPVLLTYQSHDLEHITIDKADNIYLLNDFNQIEKISLRTGSDVMLNLTGVTYPYDLKVDAFGNIFILDGSGPLLEVPVNTTHAITLIANFSQPGIDQLGKMTIDAYGNIYVADTGNQNMRKVIRGATKPAQLFLGKGYPEFMYPIDVVADSVGNVYMADINTQALKIFNAGGFSITPGLPSGLSFDYTTGIISGTPTVASSSKNYTITAYNSSGSTSTVVNITVKHYPFPVLSYPGPNALTINKPVAPQLAPASSNVEASGGYTFTAPITQFTYITSAAVDHAGSLYINGYNGIRKYPGHGAAAVDIATGITYYGGIAVDGAGNLFVADKHNNLIKKVPAGGGSAVIFASGFSTPNGLAVDSAGNVYVANMGNGLVQKITADGTTKTNLGPVFSSPKAVAVDGLGNVYVTDTGFVKKILPGSHTAVQLGHPATVLNGICVDGAGNVYYIEAFSPFVKEIPAAGGSVISLDCSLGRPLGITVDYQGILYAVDPQGGAVKKFTPTGGFYINRSLPAGLAFNINTGKISGTPTVITPATNYTVIGYNIGGSASTTFSVSTGYTAYLSKIALSIGTLTPAFSPTIANYTASVAFSNSSIKITPTAQNPAYQIKINGTAIASGSASANLPLAIGPNIFNITVTSLDSVTTKTYSVTVTRPGSANSSLSALTLSTGTVSPDFAAGTKNYTAAVPYATNKITITPTAANPAATIKVNGTAVASGAASKTIPLTFGPNTISVAVTAQDGVTTKIYAITVTRTGSGNATLNGLSLSNGTLSPAFAVGTTNYTTDVGNTASITVTPIAGNPASTIKVNGITVASGSASGPIPLAGGVNIINTVVTAQDGTTIKTYKVTVNHAPSTNAGLASLTMGNGPLIPEFNTATTSYSYLESYDISSVKITPTVSEAGATIKVNGVMVKSGSASGVIHIEVGPNPISIIVTAQDGVTTKTYTLTVIRGPSTNATLSALVLSSGTLSPVFEVSTVRYTAGVDNSTNSITVTPTAGNPVATIKINGITVASGATSGNIALAVGQNTINAAVSAQDGIGFRTYVVTVTRAASGMAAQYVVEKTGSLQTEGLAVHQNVSPNGDGQGDVLVIDGITNYPINTLQIMNRGGELVYQVKGYDNVNKAFDGQSNINGKLQQPGTYFYSLEYKDGDETRRKTGYIVLKY